jgi:hypothetical protein
MRAAVSVEIETKKAGQWSDCRPLVNKRYSLKGMIMMVAEKSYVVKPVRLVKVSQNGRFIKWLVIR